MSSYLQDDEKDSSVEESITLNENHVEMTNDETKIRYHPDGTILDPTDPDDAELRPSMLKSVAGYIIVAEFCERLAYYGFAGSLVLFFQTQLNMSNADADVNYSAWSGSAYVTPLLGGYIADTYLGRAKTIILFCTIYLVGLIMVVIGSVPDAVDEAFFFPAIYIIALGTGGIKPNVSTLGADQFDDRYSRDRREKQSFFSWFYWSINFGSLISHTLVAYICQYGIPGLGGEDWGFFWGYLIPAVMMGVAVIVFLLGMRRFTMIPPAGSVLTTAIRIIYDALWVRRNEPRPASGKIIDKSMPAGHKEGASLMSATRDDDELHLTAHADNYDSSSSNFTVAEVRGVKSVVRLMPFLIALIPFWGAYSQMSTAFQNQGCQMDLDLSDGVRVPVSTLTCFDTLSILILVPILDSFVYPWLRKKNMMPTMLQKIGLGFFTIICAMMMACIIEVVRKDYAPAEAYYDDKDARDNISPCRSLDDFNPNVYADWYSGIGDEDEPASCWNICDIKDSSGRLLLSCVECDYIPQMSRLSVFYQVFQFVLVGLSEVLATVTALEFFYSQAPITMRSVTQSLNLGTSACGSFLTIPLLLAVNGNKNDQWVPENLDEGHLEAYFGLLGGLVFLALIYFVIIASRYEYKTAEDIASEQETIRQNIIHEAEDDKDYEGLAGDAET